MGKLLSVYGKYISHFKYQLSFNKATQESLKSVLKDLPFDKQERIRESLSNLNAEIVFLEIWLDKFERIEKELQNENSN